MLTEFRLRLIENDNARILFEKLLEKLKDAGFVKVRGRQRTDSTRVLGAVHDLNRLECIWEVMRVALNELAVIAPDWLTAQVAPDWFDRYARRPEGVRWSEAKREAFFEEIGRDGWCLLGTINRTATTVVQFAALPAVEVLRQIRVQQFSFEAGKLKKRQHGNHPPGKLMIRSPFDVEMRLSRKREQEWQGYKVHLTETVTPDGIQLITDVQTTAAADSDKEVLPNIQAQLAANGLLPETQLVDAGYVTAAQLVKSREQYQVDLCGPLMRDPSWQAKAERGFAAADFKIDWENRKAMCPQGKVSSNWQSAVADYGMEIFYIRFLKKDCAVCPTKTDCTTAKSQRRTITVNARPYHEAMQTARRRQKTAEFQAEYQKRSGIEGTISQGVRAFGLRKARYRGLAKTSLQHYATATAMNIARLGAWWAGVPREKTRESAFQKLRAAMA